MSFKIVNVVTTGDLSQQVDINEIALLPHTIHDIEIYGGRVTYLKTPVMKGKVTIFPSGKLISVGTKSPDDANQDLLSTVVFLSKHNIIKPVSIKSKTRNLVAVTTFTGDLNLETAVDLIGALYEPEQFPGAIFRTEKPKATYLIFQSRKIVITGTNNIQDLEIAVQLIHDLLLQYE